MKFHKKKGRYSSLRDTRKANRVLGWEAELSLEEALGSAEVGEKNKRIIK